MSSPETTTAPTVRRHPSAGNLAGETEPSPPSTRPAPQIPHYAFPLGAEQASPLLLGPNLDPEVCRRLIGSVEGKRILELGCGSGRLSIALARAGARVISVDTSAERVEDARALADQHEVKVEHHHCDLADLAFIRGDQIDLTLSVYGLSAVSDLGRVFRQVNRVLRSEATFLMSIPHPMSLMTLVEGNTISLQRTYYDASPIPWNIEGETGSVVPHQIGDVVTTLWRSNFRVDSLLEPKAILGGPTHNTSVSEWTPTTLIVRSRKQGV